MINKANLAGRRILLVGYGDIASRLAPLLVASGAQVDALKRSPASLAAGCQLLQADVTKPESLTLLADCTYDYLVFTLTPASMDEQGYRQVYVQGLQNVLAVTQPTRRLFWTSSTSVFGQSDGSEVDELSPCEPRGFAGRVQLEAEQVVLSQSLPATVLRLGGVYGPGRTRLIQQVRDGVGTASEPVFYSNRIHVADAAAAFGHLMALDAAEQTLFPLYLGVDGDSSPLAEVKHWLAQRMGLQDHWKTMAAAKGRGGSKRCSNERLRQSGFSFQYASFRQGYGEMLAEMGLLKPDAAAG